MIEPFNKIESKQVEQVVMNPMACQEHVNDENLPSINKTKHPTKGEKRYKMASLYKQKNPPKRANH
jgi:hypothetical protein